MGRNLGKPLPPVLLRLMQLYGADDLSELAKKLGKSYSTVRNWHTREAVPEEYIERAIREKNVPESWLREGGGEQPPPSSFVRSHIELNKSVVPALLTHATGPDPVSGTGGYQMSETAHAAHESARLSAMESSQSEEAAPNAKQLDWVIVPRYGAQLPEPIGDIALSPVWMRKMFGRAGAGFVTAEVTGNSMEPTLFAGDTVIIDTMRTDVDVGGIFALRRGDDVLVKRLQRKFAGELAIISDNPVYQTEELREQDADSVAVIGRVVWPRVR